MCGVRDVCGVGPLRSVQELELYPRGGPSALEAGSTSSGAVSAWLATEVRLDVLWCGWEESLLGGRLALDQHVVLIVAWHLQLWTPSTSVPSPPLSPFL